MRAPFAQPSDSLVLFAWDSPRRYAVRSRGRSRCVEAALDRIRRLKIVDQWRRGGAEQMGVPNWNLQVRNPRAMATPLHHRRARRNHLHSFGSLDKRARSAMTMAHRYWLAHSIRPFS